MSQLFSACHWLCFLRWSTLPPWSSYTFLSTLLCGCVLSLRSDLSVRRCYAKPLLSKLDCYSANQKENRYSKKMSIPYIMCDFILISRILCASYRKLNIFAVPFRGINPFKLYISISILFWGFYEPIIWSGILCRYSWTSALVSLPAEIKVEENISCLNYISTWWQFAYFSVGV